MTRHETRLAAALWAALWPSAAYASNSPLFCTLFAREQVKLFAGSLAPVDAQTLLIETLQREYDGHFLMCIDNPDEPKMAVSALEGDEVFLGHVLAALHAPRPGDVPASGPKGEASPSAAGDMICGRSRPEAGPAGSEERKKYCKANFRTFRADGTIVCSRKHKRSPCA